MKRYKVIFSPSFTKMFKDVLNRYLNYSSTYAYKVQKQVYEAINILQIFPYATPTIKFRGTLKYIGSLLLKKDFL